MILILRPVQSCKACFPLGEFVHVNRKKTQLDWLATNTDDITTQSHSLFACSHEKFAKCKMGLITSMNFDEFHNSRRVNIGGFTMRKIQSIFVLNETQSYTVTHYTKVTFHCIPTLPHTHLLEGILHVS